MIYAKEIKGKYLKLRSVEIEDSGFILSLRINSELNAYLNKVDNDIEKQRKWILEQHQREGDYYFLMMDHADKPLGTISLYKIIDGQGEFGRWVSIGNSVQNVESVILIHDFGFYEIGLNRIYSKTVSDNRRVNKFHNRFGAKDIKIINDTASGFVLQEKEIFRESYPGIRARNLELIDKLK